MNRRFPRPPGPPLVLLLGALPWIAVAAGPRLDPALLQSLLATEFARQGGDVHAAASHALVAARQASDPALAAEAAMLALQADDAARAAAALEHWQWLQPKSTARDVLALRLQLAQGEEDSAVATALRLLAAGAIASVVEGLAVKYADGGVMARAVLRRLLVEPGFPQQIEAGLAMAGAARRIGDPVLSGQWVEALLQRFPDDPRAALLRAERLQQQGQREAARAELRILLGRRGLGDEPRRLAAEALALLGDPRAAAQALAAGPQDPGLLGLRASWLARAGDLDGLRGLYAETQALLPRAGPAPALLLLLGELAERLQDWPAAEHWYGRLDRGEAGGLARLRMAVVQVRLGRAADARIILRALQDDEALEGELRRDAFLLEADLEQAAGRAEAAKAALGRGLAVLEDDPALRVARAQLDRRAGRLADAEQGLRRVLVRDPEHPAALRALGTLMLERQRHEEARSLLARAWALQPGAPTAAALGEALWRLGREADAWQAWQSGLALDPEDPVLVDTLKRHRP